MIRAKTLVLVAVVLTPGLVHAEGSPLRSACQNDIQTLCGSMQPGGGRIRDCMRQHRTELSAACKMAIADRMLERSPQRGPASPSGPAAASPPNASITPVPKP